MAINESIKKAAAEALAAINQYDRERFTHGTNRVRLYYSDVDGDWLDEFQESHAPSASIVKKYNLDHSDVSGDCLNEFQEGHNPSRSVIQKYNLDPKIIKHYLIIHQWRQDNPVDNHHSIWRLRTSDIDRVLRLPLNPEDPNFLDQMYDVVNVLSSVEKRPESEFLKDFVVQSK